MTSTNRFTCLGDRKIDHINETLSQVKQTMYTNIDKVLERGEKIEFLVDKSDNLNAHANQFKSRAKTLKNRLWWQNVMMMLIVFLVVVVVIYIIAAMACGFSLDDC